MPNKLQYETSPYLLQHAHNPVDWYPWGEEAFDRAKVEHKPVLVSIGYSACHWCHVMERESFENSGVAAFMNRHFINIKVDREEHPDVDHMYMDALQATTGSGGWPLNMFVTPDRKPFYGGTYFPPEKMYNRASWMDVLQAIQQSWEFKEDEIELQAQQMVQHLQQSSLIAKDASGILTKEMPDAIAAQFMKQADENYGGFGQAPKFPSTMGIIYLLQHYHFAKNEASLKHALFSLDAMINGGIYDQIGGGFARYTTDSHWLVPHFEKMLYDNALLISAMSHAYRITKQEHYRRTIGETIAFCNRELSDGKGFYCALDADSEGVEGKYYTWTWQEWKQALPGMHPAVEEYLNVTPSGNWEGTNILNCPVGEQHILDKYNLKRDEWLTMLEDVRKRLFETRSKRIRPGTDDKMLLSWNALMNIALVDAATALDRNDYLLQADVHMEWMLDTFRMNPSGLFHVAKNGEAKIAGKLDDYAFIVKALFHLASGIGNTDYLKIAAELMEYIMLHFSDEENRFFYFSSDMQSDIPVRKRETYDGALPSANSVMMENLYLAGSLSEDISYMKRCEQMLQDMAQITSMYPLSFSNWAIFLQKHINGIKQLIIAGSNANEMIRDWGRHYFPGIYSFSCDKATTCSRAFQDKFNPGYDYLYLCEQFACQQPVSDIKALIKAIKF